MMHEYQVGSLYHPGRTSWPECAQYSFRGREHELLLFWNRPSDADVQAARTGAMYFALVERPPVILFCYHIDGACGWSDAPFSYHLVPEHERALPSLDLGPDTRAQQSTMLVDSATGILKAIRAISLSPDFTRQLHLAIERQVEARWDAAKYAQALAKIYQIFASTTVMVSKAATARCQGAL